MVVIVNGLPGQAVPVHVVLDSSHVQGTVPTPNQTLVVKTVTTLEILWRQLYVILTSDVQVALRKFKI